MRTTISFAGGFYRDHAGAQRGAIKNSQKPGRTLLSDERFQGASIESLMATDDFKALKHEYVELIGGFMEFLEKNSSKVNPPISRETIETVKQNLGIFSSHISDVSHDYYQGHKSVVYGAGKEYAHTLADLLQTESIPLQSRLDTVVEMSEPLALCSGGVMTALQGAVTDLQCSTGGIQSAAHRVKIKTIENLIKEFLVEIGESYEPGSEVHFVNAYYNELSDELGVPKRNDPFIVLGGRSKTRAKVARCREQVLYRLNPKLLVKKMADNYLDQVKGVQQVNVNAPIPVDKYQDVISRNDAIKATTLDKEYGDVKLENYISIDEDGMEMVFAKQSTLIAKQFFESLKIEGYVNYDDAIPLNEDRGNGVIKMLGDLCWRDVGGSCEEIDGEKLMELSPRSVSGNLARTGLSAPQQRDVFAALVKNIYEVIDNNGSINIQGEWFSEFSKLIKPLEMSDADTSPVVHLAATTGSADGMLALIKSGANPKSLNSENSDPLMTAVENGHVAVVDVLMNQGVKALSRFQNKAGDHVFSIAARCENSQVLRRLLQIPDRVDVNQPASLRKLTPGRMRSQFHVNTDRSDRNKPLHEAAKCGHVENLKVLIWAGARVNATNQVLLRETPLMVAAQNDHPEAVRVLLDRGARIDARDVYGYTALIHASRRGHTDVLEVLLQKQADIEAEDFKNSTALIHAALGGHSGVLRALLNKGASPEVVNEDGATPLIGAAQSGSVDSVNVLLNFEANIEAKCETMGATALTHASIGGRVDVVTALLGRRADVEAKDKKGRTALMHAAASGHPAVITALLDKGADIEAKDSMEATPLMHAAENNQAHVIEALRKKGADIEARDTHMQTALMRASNNARAESVAMLLRHGAYAEAVNADGQTSLMLVADQNQLGCLKALVEGKAKVNAVDPEGRTALILAAKHIGSAETVQYLLDHGADIHAQDHEGRTALTHAQQRGDAAVLGVLQSWLQRTADRDT